MYVNAKMISIETTPRNWGRGNKGEQQRGWIHVWYIWYIARTCIMPQFTPTQHNNDGKKSDKNGWHLWKCLFSYLKVCLYYCLSF
jgi:hypothetical protein